MAFFFFHEQLQIFVPKATSATISVQLKGSVGDSKQLFPAAYFLRDVTTGRSELSLIVPGETPSLLGCQQSGTVNCGINFVATNESFISKVTPSVAKRGDNITLHGNFTAGLSATNVGVQFEPYPGHWINCSVFAVNSSALSCQIDKSSTVPGNSYNDNVPFRVNVLNQSAVFTNYTGFKYDVAVSQANRRCLSSDCLNQTIVFRGYGFPTSSALHVIPGFDINLSTVLNYTTVQYSSDMNPQTVCEFSSYDFAQCQLSFTDSSLNLVPYDFYSYLRLNYGNAGVRMEALQTVVETYSTPNLPTDSSNPTFSIQPSNMAVDPIDGTKFNIYVQVNAEIGLFKLNPCNGTQYSSASSYYSPLVWEEKGRSFSSGTTVFSVWVAPTNTKASAGKTVCMTGLFKFVNSSSALTLYDFSQDFFFNITKTDEDDSLVRCRYVMSS